MQATGLLEDVGAGAQVQMVGVSQDNVGADIGLEFLRVDPFYRAEGPYRHKDGGGDFAMGGV
jgi:hypothetical protein